MVLIDPFEGELICEYPVQEQGANTCTLQTHSHWTHIFKCGVGLCQECLKEGRFCSACVDRQVKHQTWRTQWFLFASFRHGVICLVFNSTVCRVRWFSLGLTFWQKVSNSRRMWIWIVCRQHELQNYQGPKPLSQSHVQPATCPTLQEPGQSHSNKSREISTQRPRPLFYRFCVIGCPLI